MKISGSISISKIALGKFTALIVSLLIVTGCQTPIQETQVPTPAVTEELPQENTAIATETTPPTKTPLPPTDTPTPTITPTPSPTNTPTITPTFSPDTLLFQPGEPLKIGYLLWESQPSGTDSKRAIEIAIQDFGGEISGHAIELVGYDDECSDLGGQRGAQLLAQDDSVVGIIGTNCSRSSLRAAPIITNASKVLISPSATVPELTSPDTHAAGFFRTAPNDIYQLNAVAQYAINNLSLRKMVSIYTAYSKPQELWSKHMCNIFRDLGGECVLERPIENGTTYLAPTVNAIIESEADVMIMIILDTQVAGRLISELKNTPGLENLAIFIWEYLSAPGLLEQTGDDAVGVYTAATGHEFDQRAAAYQIFLTAYRLKYAVNPLTDFHAYAYDAANLLLNAVTTVAVQDEQGTLHVDPLAVREAIYRQTNFPGLTGNLNCSSLGDCAVIVDGKIYQFTSGDPNTYNPGPAGSLSSNPSQVWP